MKIDWYKHYLEKGKLVLTKETLGENLKQDKPFLDILRKYVPARSKILEAGCGLGRTCISMSIKSYRVTAIDIDDRMLSLAQMSAKNCSQKIAFKKSDFFNLYKILKKNSFDCITHQGVLEHYSIKQIRNALNTQLKISPLVIFSVPIDSPYNKKYFHDNIYRNLWNEIFWIKSILKIFDIRYHKIARDRKDNLIVVLKRK